MMSRIVCAVFGIFMGLVGVILNVFTVTAASFDADTCSYKADCGGESGISLGWVYQFMGNAIGSAVLPVAWSIVEGLLRRRRRRRRVETSSARSSRGSRSPATSSAR